MTTRPVAVLALALGFGLAGAIGARPARAQVPPQLEAHTDVDTVAVGDVVHLQFNAQSGEGMPADPQPGATPGFAVGRASSSPSQTHININGTCASR
jgi:hypothetical protein